MNRGVFERYIQSLAFDLASKPNFYSHKQHHACVITYQNTVLSTGVNINLKHPFTDPYNPLKSLHAESLAILRAIQKHHSILPYSELWVCRVKNGKLLYSKPCVMCERIIKTFSIPTTHYTDYNGEWVSERL